MDTFGKLYLFPSPLSPNGQVHIPQFVLDHMASLKYIITERIRTTRRFLKSVHPSIDIDGISFIEMDKHDKKPDPSFITWCKDGHDVGLFSEAGIPCVADPGYRYVDLAHDYGIIVAPLTGPNSIMLALMASGFSGQHFEFHGYLSRDKSDLKDQLISIERSAIKSKKTHLFIETPYRNLQMIDQMIGSLQKSTQICIAADLSSQREFISQIRVKDLKKIRPHFEEKKPAIFIIGCHD